MEIRIDSLEELKEISRIVNAAECLDNIMSMPDEGEEEVKTTENNFILNIN